MSETTIQSIENYVRDIMSQNIAHDFKHVDRVRSWALYIAKIEGYPNLALVEAAALLHDIGLAFCEYRKVHGQVGADIAFKYLSENNYFSKEQVTEIINVIKYHNTKKDDNGELLYIIRDADMMDLFGSVGIMRAFTSKVSKPEYDCDNIKGDTWGLTANDFDIRFSDGTGIGQYIIDQINFQISCSDNLKTNTAKELAKPLLNFMKNYILQLESEITESKTLSLS
jgi:HD superfamily phosphodiesterase